MKTTAALTRTAAAQGARRKRFRKALPLMILSLPAVISIFVFCYMPMFGLFYFIPRDTGMIYSVTDVIDTYVYRALRVTGDIGMSAAVTFYQSVVGFLLVMITNFIIRKISPEDALF